MISSILELGGILWIRRRAAKWLDENEYCDSSQVDRRNWIFFTLSEILIIKAELLKTPKLEKRALELLMEDSEAKSWHCIYPKKVLKICGSSSVGQWKKEGDLNGFWDEREFDQGRCQNHQ